MNRIVILLLFTTFLLFHLWLTFSGFYGNDDVNYSRYAASFIHGNFSLVDSSQYILRWPTILTTSFFYYLFGINDFSSSIWSFLCITGCGWLIYAELKKENRLQYLVSLVLFFFSASIIFYTHRLLPDPGIALSFFAGFVLYRKQKVLSSQTSKLLYGLLFACTIFFGLLTKETIILALPLWLFWLLIDIARKQSRFFWTTAAIAFVFLVMAYLAFFKLSTGSFLYRYHVLQENSYLNECSFDQLPAIETIKRVVYLLWKAMLLNGDMLILIPAVCSFFYKNKLNLSSSLTYATNSFMVLLLSADLMTISFTGYVPLCHDPRHFLFLIPFAAIVGAPVVIAYFKTPDRFTLLLVSFLVATGLMYFLHAGTTKYLYGLVSALLALSLILSRLKTGLDYRIFVSAFCLLFALNYLSDFVKPKYPFHNDQKKIVTTQLKTTRHPAIVFTDDLTTAEMAQYFLDFQEQPLTIHPLSGNEKIDSASNIYFLFNGDRHPEFALRIDSPWYRQHMTVQMKSGNSVLLRSDKLAIDSLRTQR